MKLEYRTTLIFCKFIENSCFTNCPLLHLVLRYYGCTWYLVTMVALGTPLLWFYVHYPLKRECWTTLFCIFPLTDIMLHKLSAVALGPAPLWLHYVYLVESSRKHFVLLYQPYDDGRIKLIWLWGSTASLSTNLCHGIKSTLFIHILSLHKFFYTLSYCYCIRVSK